MTTNLELSGATVTGIGVGAQAEVIEIACDHPAGTNTPFIHTAMGTSALRRRYNP